MLLHNVKLIRLTIPLIAISLLTSFQLHEHWDYSFYILKIYSDHLKGLELGTIGCTDAIVAPLGGSKSSSVMFIMKQVGQNRFNGYRVSEIKIAKVEFKWIKVGKLSIK